MLVITAGALVVFVHTHTGRGIIRDRIDEQLEGVFVGDVSIGEVDGSVFGELVVRDVVVEDEHDARVLSIGAVRLRLRLLPLLSRHLHFDEVSLEDVAVSVPHDPSDLLRSGDGSGWGIQIDRLQIARGSVSIDGQTPVTFHDLGLEGSVYSRAGEVRLSAVASASWVEEGLTVEALVGGAHIDPQRVVVPFARFRVSNGRARALAIVFDRRKAALGGIAHASIPSAQRPIAGLRIPESSFVVAVSPRSSGNTRVELAGELMRWPVRASLQLDRTARELTGTVTTRRFDLGPWTGGVVGEISARAEIDLQRQSSGWPTGSITLDGRAQFGRHGVGVHSTLEIERGSAGSRRVAFAARLTDKRGRVDLSGVASVADESIEIEHAGLTGTLHEISLDALVAAKIDADLRLRGSVRPALALVVDGRVGARDLRTRRLRIAAATATLDDVELPRMAGRLAIRGQDIEAGSLALRHFEATGKGSRGEAIELAIATVTRDGPWHASIHGVATERPHGVHIALQHHDVLPPAGPRWSGHSGTITVDPRRIAIRGLTSGSGDSRVSVSGELSTGSQDFRLGVAARHLALSQLAEPVTGILDARIDLQRSRGRTSGNIHFVGRQIELAGFDARFGMRMNTSIDGRRLAIAAEAASAEVGHLTGSAKLVLAGDVTDPSAWKDLDLEGLRSVELVLRDVNLSSLSTVAKLEGLTRGRLDARLAIAHGNLDLEATGHDVVSGWFPRPSEARLQLTGRDGELVARVTSRSDAGWLAGEVSLEMPRRLRDVEAWRAIDRRAVRHVELRARDLQCDPALLARFGIVADVGGTVNVTLTAGDQLRTAQFAADIDEVALPGVVGAYRITASGELDNQLRATLRASSAHRSLVQADVRLSLSLEQLLDAPRDVLVAPLAIHLLVPNAPAKMLLAAAGRRGIRDGTIAGTVDVRGTVRRPEVEMSLSGAAIQVAATPGSVPIERVTVNGHWRNDTGSAQLWLRQRKGTLFAVANVPALRAKSTLRIEARELDLASLTPLVPDAWVGLAGTLGAHLVVTGFDSSTSRVNGHVQLTDGRIPLIPQLGALRRANIHVAVADRVATVKLTGSVRGGEIRADGSLALDGLMPRHGRFAVRVDDVSPIGELEPSIDGDLTVDLRRQDRVWRAGVTLRQGSITIPDRDGERLAPIGAPDDMVFVDDREKDTEHGPEVIVAVDLTPTFVESPEARGWVSGRLEVRTTDGAPLVFGRLEARRGTLELFERRYRIDRAIAIFDGKNQPDGTPDPRLDIQMTYTFPEVTTITELRGRLSNPELIVRASNGAYTEGQLVAFLFGGSPDRDEDSSPGQLGISAGTSYLANRLAGFVRRALPFDIEVLRYRAATATTSAALTLGTWLSDVMFIAYRRHIEARPDESSNEVELEYWISPRVLFEIEVGDRGEYGGDLLWRRRY